MLDFAEWAERVHVLDQQVEFQKEMAQRSEENATQLSVWMQRARAVFDALHLVTVVPSRPMSDTRDKAIEHLAAILAMKPMDADDVAYEGRLPTFRDPTLIPPQARAYHIDMARRVFDLLGLTVVDRARTRELLRVIAAGMTVPECEWAYDELFEALLEERPPDSGDPAVIAQLGAKP